VVQADRRTDLGTGGQGDPSGVSWTCWVRRQDNRGPVQATEYLPIHRPPPSFEQQAGGQDLLVTGIKVIDLLVPFAKGGKVGLFRRAPPESARPSTCSRLIQPTSPKQ